MGLLLRLVAALARNAVPVYGVLVLGWTPGALVVLFVVDVVLTIGATGLRIRAHDAASRDPRHRDPAAYRELPGIRMDTPRKVFWRDYVEFAFPRAVILGIMAYGFPLIITLELPEQRPWLLPDWSAVALGTAGLLVGHALARLAEAGRLAQAPFAAMHAAARDGYAQVLLLSALVMGGCFAALATKDVRAVALVLIALKLLMDLAEAVLRDRLSRTPDGFRGHP